MDSWRHELIVCKKWYKNNLKLRLTNYFLIHVGMHHTIDGGTYLANGRVGNGGHYCQLPLMQHKKATISQENYPNNDGAKIDSGKTCIVSQDMIGK